MFARRRGLVIAPGLLHMAGMAKQALSPNSDATEIRQANRAVRHRDFRVAESMGFKGDYRQWEQLMRVGD